MATHKQIVRLGLRALDAYRGCGSNSVSFSGSNWNYFQNRFGYRHISQLVNPNGKRAFLVDTLALVKRLQAEGGLQSKEAEAITSVITDVLNDSLESISHLAVSKVDMQKSEMKLESNISKFQSEVRIVQEKLQNDIEKMRSEQRYEIDKLKAGQRLDLNLERGRTRDELLNQSAETSNLTHRLDGEIHALRAQLEAAKYEVIKYCIGTLVSISAVGLAIVRLYL